MFIRVEPPRNAPMTAGSSYPKIWQIFGKMVFDDPSPEMVKVRIAAYLLVIVMVGLGGLEPPTSPLSGAFMVLYA